jgi:hypothetical protein
LLQGLLIFESQWLRVGGFGSMGCFDPLNKFTRFEGEVSMRRIAWVFVVGISSILFGASKESFGCDHCVAQQKAQQQASEGRCRHVGGSMGAGRYEGVGFSTVSADHAVSRCCYWGQRQAIGIGVAKGRNGWYATVLYR